MGRRIRALGASDGGRGAERSPRHPQVLSQLDAFLRFIQSALQATSTLSWCLLVTQVACGQVRWVFPGLWHPLLLPCKTSSITSLPPMSQDASPPTVGV